MIALDNLAIQAVKSLLLIIVIDYQFVIITSMSGGLPLVLVVCCIACTRLWVVLLLP